MRAILVLFLLALSGCALFRSWDFDCLDARDRNPKLTVEAKTGNQVGHVCGPIKGKRPDESKGDDE